MSLRSSAQESLFEQSNSLFGRDFSHEPRSTGVDSCLPWLTRSGLTINVEDYYQIEATRGEASQDLTQGALLGVPVHRCEPKTSRELHRIKSLYKGQPPPGIDPNSSESIERLWQDLQSDRSRVIDFQFSPVGWNAIACYWPFHLHAGRWGIYISAPKIIAYANRLLDACGGRLAFLGSVESMLRCALFTIFHHEFFHHIVESTATSLEIASAAFGPPRPLYRDYRRRAYEERLGLHPHRPLEEALANAYAHNSLGFVSRMQLGYVVGEARTFQKVFQTSWSHQGAGYASAGHYAGQNRGPDGYIGGAAQLLAMILNSTDLDPTSLRLLAQSVMPRGHTAFAEKARIPTYLVGSNPEIESFNMLLPAATESYTSLFFHRDTTEIDDALQERRRKAQGENLRGPAL